MWRYMASLRERERLWNQCMSKRVAVCYSTETHKIWFASL